MPMSGWQLSGDAPSLYEQYDLIAIKPWTDDLIREAGCQEHDRILDVACGTGYVAKRVNAVSGATCKVSGLDVNEPMLNAARKIPGIDWRLGSATNLPFDDASFEVVLCQQGLQFFPDRRTAMKEMARVLTPNGKISLSVWGKLERCVFHCAFAKTVGTFFGSDTMSTFDMAFSLNTREELHDLAAGAGFRDIAITYHHRTIRHASVDDYANGFIQAMPVAAKYLALPDSDKKRFGGQVAALPSDYVDDHGLAASMGSHYLLATR
jgi:ubiquinone/menaquinone biosynthesis C-methylase UbiE